MAVIDVKPASIDVELEIMLEDLVMVHQLAADGNMQYSAEDLRRAAKAHPELLLRWFTILDADGQRLKGELKAQDATEIADQGVGQTELMRRTVRYQFVYPLAAPPKFFDIHAKDGRRDFRSAGRDWTCISLKKEPSATNRHRFCSAARIQPSSIGNRSPRESG